MSCSTPQLPAGRAKVSVNGVPILREAIAREVQHHPAGKPADAWRAAAKALVVRELLRQEAKRLGISAEPLADSEGRRETDDEAALRALVEREVVTPEPTEAECRRYFERNRERFRSPEMWEVSHILIQASANDPDGYARASEAARRLCEALSREPALFEDLARAHSGCASSSDGGRLGQITPGETTREFEAALRSMQSGSMSREPVATRYGFHIIRLDAHCPGRALAFDTVRDLVARYLAESVRRRALAQYVSWLASRAAVTGIDIAAVSGPLMQ